MIALDQDVNENLTVKLNPAGYNPTRKIDSRLSDNGNRKIIVRVQKQKDIGNDYDKDLNMALFTVEDNGIGINPEKADKL